MGFVYRIIGLFLMVIGGYIGFNTYEGVFGEWINDTFLRNIYSLLILGAYGLAFVLVTSGLAWFLGNHPINQQKKLEQEEAEALAEQEELKQQQILQKQQELEKQKEERLQREKIAKEEEELAKQKEIQRLNSLPKCPSCSEPLDEKNNTFTRTLKEKKVLNIKITHKEFEFYNHVGDISKINSIRCHHCNNSFNEETFEESASKTIKAKCPNCESFDTKFKQKETIDSDGVPTYSVVCKCNDCSHSWHSTHKEEQLKEQKQAELEQKRKEAIEYQKQQDKQKQQAQEQKERELELKEKEIALKQQQLD
ncbi:MAG: hypothetical protein U9O56_08640, partial [Campylobacterota bacterium]|nr:hypothetical protein [Campylobacterota bacterium]